MIVFIPCVKGKPVPKEVIDSLKNQSEKVDIRFVEQLEGIPSEFVEKMRCMRRNRQRCIELARKVNEPFVALNNSDIVHLFPENLSDAVVFLKANSDWGAVAFSSRSTHPIEREHCHVMDSSIVIRKEALDIIDYNKERSPGDCSCTVIGECLQPKYRYGIFDDVIRIKDLKL